MIGGGREIPVSIYSQCESFTLEALHLRSFVARGLSAELDVDLIPEFLLLPRSLADDQGQLVKVLVFGLLVSHVLEDQLEQVNGLLLHLLVSGLDHRLLDRILRGGVGGGMWVGEV